MLVFLDQILVGDISKDFTALTDLSIWECHAYRAKTYCKYFSREMYPNMIFVNVFIYHTCNRLILIAAGERPTSPLSALLLNTAL